MEDTFKTADEVRAENRGETLEETPVKKSKKVDDTKTVENENDK